MRNMFIMKARAKINIGLKVLARRRDGYHDLETIMQRIGLCDLLYFDRDSITGEKIEVECLGASIEPESNLVYRSALLLQQRYGCARGIRIVLVKNIPMGAGLAGGSTDAAATLMALNLLWGLHLPFQELLDAGESIGADVPFCLTGGTVMVRGKGEILKPLPGLPYFGVVISRPRGLFLSTGEIYDRLDRFARKSFYTYDTFISALRCGDRSAILNWLEKENLNDLEQVVVKHNPDVAVLKDLFRLMGINPVMTGSGPCVFSLVEGYKEAREAAFLLEQHGYETWASWTE